eukprot:TRINITY_DN2042_c0_g1_i1.p1 TRINITY_DN2042_c0_g1~~TRINITY_DN2042_c0_g1_i1.p1  ORF type:complete len:222 (+),score=48.32 TRINITY_DN2042_c0_g1_i1:94-759(+)
MAFEVRGVIEGFFGHCYSQDPARGLWTMQQRMWVADLMAAKRQNTFVYAAKCDRKSMRDWRTAYTQVEMQEWAAFVRYCEERGITFVYGISPGANISMTGPALESDCAAAADKFSAFLRAGCRGFALCFDDGPMTATATDPSSGREVTLGEAHATAANVIRQLVEARAADMGLSGLSWYLCPRLYSGPEMLTHPHMASVKRTYLEQLNAISDPTFMFFWTG